MTTPTREQVARPLHYSYEDVVIMQRDFVNKILDLEVAIAEQAKQIEDNMPLDIDAEYERQLKQLRGQIEEMAEALRVKDEAIDWIQKRCAGEAMPNWENTPHTGHSRVLILDRTNHALSIQPSPEILAARDHRVAEAVNKYLESKLSFFTCSEAIRAGEWKKYL